MGTQAQEAIAAIGAMQTIVKNFPISLLSALNPKKYDSALEFIIDVLSSIGITTKDIIEYILTYAIIPNFNVDKLQKLDEYYDADLNSPFISGLEDVLKSTIAFTLSELLSCSIRPIIPDRFIENEYGTGGIDISIASCDPTNLLETCPTSRVGKYLYSDVYSDTTPNDLDKCKDLNAVMWYSVYKDDVTWSGTTQDKKIFTLHNTTTCNSFKLSIDKSYQNATLFKFNKDYLDNVKLLSPKVIITGLYDELVNGLPMAGVSYRLSNEFSDAVLGNVIRNTIRNDDLEINDCYYSFSNTDWDDLIEEYELRKYNAKRLNSETAGAIEIDKEAVIKSLEDASNAEIVPDQTTTIERTFDEISATPTKDASLTMSDGIELAYNNNWLYELLIGMIRPIVKSVLSPKIMVLLLINYDAAGVIKIDDITKIDLQTILDLIRKKLLGIIKRIVIAIKDAIVRLLMDLLIEKIMPLIIRVTSLKLLEKLQHYLEILQQALECVRLFGIGTNVLTEIDNVTYADIIPEKITPKQSIC